MFKQNQRIEFIYTKANGSVSERDVFVISTPSDSYFTVDLSEFNEDEQAAYTRALVQLYEDLKYQTAEAVQELGLSSCYRRFKANNIS